MVHALEEIHRLLKPAGTLIDIHPVSEPLRVDVRRIDEVAVVGDLTVRQWCRDFQEADEALAEVIERGMFVVEDEGLFEAFTYYGSIAEMHEALKESAVRFARDPHSRDETTSRVEDVVRRSEEVLRSADPVAELSVRERTHIRRLGPA